MKKCMMMVAVMSASLALAQGKQAAKISLAEARSRIDRIVSSPETIATTMRQLSSEDQKTFLEDVNKAVSGMPGSLEEKSAYFLSLNTAAVASAEKGNVATIIAEVFATVPPESLTVICEQFPTNLLSRMVGSTTKISDAEYEKFALDVMEKVNERCEETDNGSARVTFAIVMLVRASGGTPPTLAETLINTLRHEDAKEAARKEWLPSALGLEGREQSYESLLASADAGRRPDLSAVLVIAGPLYGTAVLADLGGKSTEPDMFSHTKTPVLDAVENAFGQQAPRAGNEKPGGAGAAGGEAGGGAIETGQIGGGGEDTRPTPVNPDPQGSGVSPISPVRPYWLQTTN